MEDSATNLNTPRGPFPHTPSAQIMSSFASNSPETPEIGDWFKTPQIISKVYHTYDSMPFYQPIITPYQTANALGTSVFFFPFNYMLMVYIYIVGWPMMTMMTVLQWEIKYINTPISRALIPWAKIKTYLAATHPRWGWFVWWSIVAGYYSALAPVFIVQAFTCWLPVVFFDFFYLGMVGPTIFNLVINTMVAMVVWWVIVFISRSAYSTFEFFWGI